MLRFALLATLLLAACPAATRTPPKPPHDDEAPLRLRVASAEARRAGGVAELVDLGGLGGLGGPGGPGGLAGRAGHAGKRERLLALRGLGRIGATGGAQVIATLIAALRDGDPEVVGAAASAIGVAASLDDGELGATDALIAALPRGG